MDVASTIPFEALAYLFTGKEKAREGHQVQLFLGPMREASFCDTTSSALCGVPLLFAS